MYLLDLHTVGRSFLILVFMAWSTEKIPGFFLIWRCGRLVCLLRYISLKDIG
jgi:hypothetical protein